MAPEVYNETYDQRVDVWSAGVILFFLLTGDLPFFQEEDDEIL
jgi:serine/threonine protein kinase